MNQKQQKPGNPPHTIRQALPSFERAGVVEKKIQQYLKKPGNPPHTTRQALPSFGGVGGGIL